MKIYTEGRAFINHEGVKFVDLLTFHDKIMRRKEKFTIEDAFVHLITYYSNFVQSESKARKTAKEDLIHMWAEIKMLVYMVRNGQARIDQRNGADIILPPLPPNKTINKKKREPRPVLTDTEKKEAIRLQRQQYYQKNRERVKAKSRQYYNENRDVVNEKNKLRSRENTKRRKSLKT